MITSEALDQIALALAAAQGTIRAAEKNRINPHLRNQYADLESVWKACRASLSINGLSALQEVTLEDSCAAVTTRVLHKSGQWIQFGPLHVPASKQDAQGVGSAISYAKRYALCAALGIVSGDEDDDGNAASDPTQQPADPEDEKMLNVLRDAALEGSKTLMDRFNAIPKSQAKARVWAAHSRELKDAAAQADKQ